MKFEQLNLPAYIMAGLARQNFTDATDIQSKSIPLIMGGCDVVGTSQTGSGKTYAFGIPAIDMIENDKNVQVLIICPTRELAGQICEELRKLTEFKEGCKIVPVFGGASIEKQIFAIKKNAKIIVGTPGRIMDHMRRKTVKFDELKLVVLDEADEMLDMGFRDDIENILKKANPDRQTVMFSATMPKTILDITKNYMKQPVHVSGDTQGEAQAFIEQFYISVDKKSKDDTIVSLIQTIKPERAVVFCNTKRMVDDLADHMSAAGINAIGLHGDMRQNDRHRSMQNVKLNGGILVATDVAARGIDISDVNIVINYDIPSNSEYYIHRIGRTARAGKKGSAYTIINSNAQRGQIECIVRETKNEIREFKCENSKEYAMPERPQMNPPRGNSRRGTGGNTGGAKTERFSSSSETPRRSASGRPSGDRPARSFNNDRPSRTFIEDAPVEGATSSFNGDAPRRSDRPSSDRPRRTYGDKPTGDRPTRTYGDRPSRTFVDDTPVASEGGTSTYRDAPRRSDRPSSDRPRKTYGDKPNGDRPARTYGDRPARPFSDEKPRKSFSDAPRFSEGQPSEAPRKSFGDKPFGDRPSKTFGDRPSKPFGTDRLKRSGDDRPKKTYSDDKPRKPRAPKKTLDK